MTESEKKMLRVGLRARAEIHGRKAAERRAADPKGDGGHCCPACMGAGAWFGVLGSATWFRCIDCGMEFRG